MLAVSNSHIAAMPSNALVSIISQSGLGSLSVAAFLL